MSYKKSVRKSLKKMLKKSLRKSRKPCHNKSLEKSLKRILKKSLEKSKRKSRKPSTHTLSKHLYLNKKHSIKKTKRPNKSSKRSNTCKYGEHTNGYSIKKPTQKYITKYKRSVKNRHGEIANLIDNKTLIKYIKKSIRKSRKPTLLKNNVKTPIKLTAHRFQIKDDKTTDGKTTEDKTTEGKKDGESFSIFTSIFNALKSIIESIGNKLSFVSDSVKFKNNLTYLEKNQKKLEKILSNETMNDLKKLYVIVTGVELTNPNTQFLPLNPLNPFEKLFVITPPKPKKPKTETQMIKDLLKPETQVKIKIILDRIQSNVNKSIKENSSNKELLELLEKINEIINFIYRFIK